MAQFVLKIDTGNAAMVYPCQITSALKEVAEKIKEESMHNLKKMSPKKIMDINGNTVGFWQVK